MGTIKGRLPEDFIECLAAHSLKVLKSLRGYGRALALRSRSPDSGHGLSPQWLEEYGQSVKIFFGDSKTDGDCLTAVTRNRRLLPFVIPRLERKLRAAALTAEPSELEQARGFLEDLGAAIIPRTHGRIADLDPDIVRVLFDERLALNRRVQATYRTSGWFPSPHLLPVVVPKRGREDGWKTGERVTIEDVAWPREATWIFLQFFLQTPRPTLERHLGQSPKAKRRRRRHRSHTH